MLGARRNQLLFFRVFQRDFARDLALGHQLVQRLFKEVHAMGLTGLHRRADLNRLLIPNQISNRAIDHEQFNAYYEECDRAIVIRLSKPVRLTKAIPLDDLRCKWPGFHPPQQFAYMSSDRVKKISRAVGSM